MKEIWKQVITPDGVWENYQVSNLGRVKSLNYRRTGKEKILSPNKSKSGYLQINLYKNDDRKSYLIHHLVAYAFIPNTENYKEINHKDENKNNNCVENLEWCDRKYNMNYGTRNKRVSESMKGRCCDGKSHMYGKHHTEESKKKISKALKGRYCGEKNHMYGKHHTDKTKRKMSEAQKGEKHHASKKVLCIETGEIFGSVNEVKRRLGIHAPSISRVCNGKQNYAGKIDGVKLHWKYVEEVE